jgi:flagellar hook-associated protein 2
MAISSAGIGSGLDVNGIISQLMALEQRPLALLAQKEAKFQSQISAYGSLKGALSTFQSAVATLATPAKFAAVKASIADTTVATVTASSGAAAGSYSIEVQNLAQAQKLKSSPFLATTGAVGTGKLTISFGTYNADTFTPNADKVSKEITIAAGQNSLAGVRDAINAANAGVTAGIVNDGSGYLLTIASKDSGVANAVRITVADDDATHTDNAGLSQLAFDARTLSGVTNLTESIAARDAKVVIDGITVTKASNTITDAIEGVTLGLLKESTPSATTLTIARDTAGVQASVQSFVKAYNDLNKTISDLTKYDAATKKGSALTGEPTVRSLQTQLRSVFNTPLSTAGGGLTSLSDVGISFQIDGTLKLDAAKLTTALNDPAKDISTLFAAIGKPTDSLVSFTGSALETKNGVYALTLTQLPAQGKSIGGAAAALTITGSNDQLLLSVDGIAAAVTLTAGTYTAAALTAEIQSKVNGVSALSSAGVSVAVTQSGGVLTISSSRYGPTSAVTITGGSAKADLFGTPAETAGANVAGTIGGFPATGSGRTLTGTGDAAGLLLEIMGGAIGDRGTVSYSRGYAHQLDKMTGKMLETDSLVAGRVAGIDASVKDITSRREALVQRLQVVEKRLRTQFSALDAMMGRMQQTSSYLTQQLANLPGADSR